MSVKLPIYLDNNATTKMDPRVLEAMLPFLTDVYGNAASRNHSFGWAAEDAVDKARNQVAEILGCRDSEVIFTSGSTESNNLAIKGAAYMLKDKGKHIITCETEHPAVLDPCEHLESEGWEITRLRPAKATGRLSIEQIEEAIRPDTVLITIMAANNEIGTIQPMADIGRLAKEKGVWFHTDATQAVGKIPVDVESMGIDLLSISGHKLYGPKGAGALYIRKRKPRVRLEPLQDGGRHERGMRSGTLNVPGIVGLGEACALAKQDMADEAVRVSRMRDRLEKAIMDSLEETYLNGDPDHRLPGVSNIAFAFVEGEALMMGMKDIAVSSGSACTSASLEPSHVLKAIGVGEELAHSSIRFGLGRFTTDEEIDYTINQVIATVNKLRDMSPLYEMWKEGIDLTKIEWAAH